MKQIIVSFFLLGATCIGSEAQNLSLGPISGFNHSWMTNSGSNRVFNPGFSMGGRMTYSFNPHWGVGADLVGSWEGVKSRTDVAGSTTSVDADLVFLRLQPKMIYFFGELGDRVRPNIYAGTSIGALVGGNTTTKITATNEGPSVSTKVKSTDNYNSFDAGLFGGLGLNYRIGRAIWLNTDVAYHNGLVDLTKSDNSWSASRAVSFNVGVTFPIGTIKP